MGPSMASDEEISSGSKKASKRGVASILTAAVMAPASAEAATVDAPSLGVPVSDGLASGVQIASTTLPPHKLEPAITQKYAEKKRRRTASHRARKRRN